MARPKKTQEEVKDQELLVVETEVVEVEEEALPEVVEEVLACSIPEVKTVPEVSPLEAVVLSMKTYQPKLDDLLVALYRQSSNPLVRQVLKDLRADLAKLVSLV